jgi:hypothetical protein
MTLTSLQLLEKCADNGLISKEAAQQVLEKRAGLIREAMQKCAIDLFKALRRAKPAEEGGGLLSKLRHGGATGGDHPGWGDVASNLGKMMGLAGLTAGATAGVHGLLRHSRDKKLKEEQQSAFAEMSNDPKIQELEEKTPGKVARHFGILARYAPSLAADPDVAATWVRNSIHMGIVGPDMIKGLAETQQRIDEVNEHRHGVRGVTPLRAGEFATKAMGLK